MEKEFDLTEMDIVQIFPRSDAELALAAERLQKVTGAFFAGAWILEPEDRIGISPASGLEASRSGDFMRRLFRGRPFQAGVVQSIVLEQEREIWPGPKTVQVLCAVGVFAAREKARLIFGLNQAPSQQLKDVMLALANRFSMLATIADLRTEVALRNQFLSIASHELKTPLTSIYGILQLQERMIRLKKSEPEQDQRERQHTFLKMVIRQVERLNELIDGLLDVSRIQNGRFVVEPSAVDVSTLVKDAVHSRLEVIAKEAGVILHLEAPDRLGAWVDPVRLEEVVNNLVMNAVRFSPEGGVVWISLKSDADGIRLSVRDQGSSVSPDDRERIFEPFERARRTGRLGGLGLGLYISRQIAQIHGGNVTLLESVPGKGNVFEAYFPLKTMTSAA